MRAAKIEPIAPTNHDDYVSLQELTEVHLVETILSSIDKSINF